MTELQKYLQLLSLVITGLPSDAVDNAVRNGYEVINFMLNNVRICLVMNLEGVWDLGSAHKETSQ